MANIRSKEKNTTISKVISILVTYAKSIIVFFLYFVQWTVVGQHGLIGRSVTKLAVVANNLEFVVVTVHQLPMVESLALGLIRKTAHVMTSRVQVQTCFFLISLCQPIMIGTSKETLGHLVLCVHLTICSLT